MSRLITPSSAYPGLRIDGARLSRRIARLAEIGAIRGDGVCRLALSDTDREARNLVCGWMRDLGLSVTIDRIGNVVGIRDGQPELAPVMTGSHIDTVATGGRFDGSLGVLAGLEVIETLNDAGIDTRHPLAVGFFTNEEGARFAPDMLGSGVHQGALDLEEMLAVTDINGCILGAELQRIGYAGDTEVNRLRAHCYVELHVEQGPVLEQEGFAIGAVTGVQGISWSEYRITGTSNHAGTTPMHLRHDAGYLAAAISTEARNLAKTMGGSQVATVGMIRLLPNLVNVIPSEALLTLDLRNTDESLLREAERHMEAFIRQAAAREGVLVSNRKLARFEPVAFDGDMIGLVEQTAERMGLTCRRMPSGAGHDAQMFAPNCPTAMVFVPSRHGISHNVTEYTSPEALAAGANVLLHVLLNRAI